MDPSSRSTNKKFSLGRDIVVLVPNNAKDDFSIVLAGDYRKPENRSFRKHGKTISRVISKS